MGIVSPIAGAYTGTYNRNSGGALALNYTRSGFNLHVTMKGERVEETDIYGMSLIDICYRGAQMSIDMICKVYGATVVGAMWPWSTATFGNVYAAATPIGQLASTAPDVLVLAAVAATPAAATPATLTSTVVISPDNDMTVVFNSTVREVPLKFDCMLTEAGGVGTVATLT